MIILDTNVISEIMRRQPSETVLTFLDRHPEDTFHLTAITVAEIWAGVHAKSDPAQREDLTERAKTMFEMFRGRVLKFDDLAAASFGTIIGPVKRRGETIHFPDGAIAAIAKTRNAMVATRDARPFEQAGLDVVNPWDQSE